MKQARSFAAMNKDYQLLIDKALFDQSISESDWHTAFELLAEPLHEWLYRQGDFDILSQRTKLEQLILSFDYVKTQIAQGGFIQLIQNGYAPLLLTVIECLTSFNLAPEMTGVLDDALKVLVLNMETLGVETSVTEFARLYSEFPELELLESRFHADLDETLKVIVLLTAG